MNSIDPSATNSVKSQGFVPGVVQKAETDKKAIWDNDLDNSEELPKPLTRAELEVILGSEALEPSIISVKRLFALQAFVTMLSCFAWGWSVKGKPFGLDSSAISALLGGLIAIIPAGLFAIRARLLTKKVIESGVARLAVAGLVTGEIIKIIATIAMFFLVIVFYPDLDWLPLLLTYVLALKCYWLAWILRK
jgi:ATP synthase protein I